VQTDLSRWDYKHQVLESAHVPNWRVLLWVKSIEAICQLRPKSLFRLLFHRDRLFRSGMRWYSNIGRRVWVHEIWQWLLHDRRSRHGPALAEFLKGGWNRDYSTEVRKVNQEEPAKTASLSGIKRPRPFLSFSFARLGRSKRQRSPGSAYP
jgi:anaerobic magnesium-protoporphyrin IX monomethyl ester cyclase